MGRPLQAHGAARRRRVQLPPAGLQQAAAVPKRRTAADALVRRQGKAAQHPSTLLGGLSSP